MKIFLIVAMIMAAVMGLASANLEFTFHDMDGDRNGKLSRAEWEARLQRDHPKDFAQYMAKFDSYDKDKDGSINFEEFKASFD